MTSMTENKHTPTAEHGLYADSAGPWFIVDEGVPVIKRQLYLDGEPAGYELLGGDYDNLAALADRGDRA